MSLPRYLVSLGIFTLVLVGGETSAFALTVCNVGPSQTSPTNNTWGAQSGCQCGLDQTSKFIGIVQGSRASNFEWFQIGDGNSSIVPVQVWAQTLENFLGQTSTTWVYADHIENPTPFSTKLETHKYFGTPDMTFKSPFWYRGVCAW